MFVPEKFKILKQQANARLPCKIVKLCEEDQISGRSEITKNRRLFHLTMTHESEVFGVKTNENGIFVREM